MNSSTEPDPEDVFDTQLMLRVRNGDMGAMETLVEKYQHSIHATIAGMLRNSTEVEDIAQQVFIRIWKAAGTYEPTAKFKTWMYTILRNQVFNEMRRLKRKPAFSADALEEANGLTLSVDEKPSPDEEILHSELERAIDRAIGSLPEKARLAVQLRRYDNMSYEEIAHALGITVSATKSLLFRARVILKEALGDYLG